MNSEEIKVGNYYKIDARIGYKTKEGNYGVTIMYPNGINSTVEFTPSEAALAFCNNSPKYDPCRLFKKGDEVRYCERDGRKLFRLHDGAIYEVKSDEGDAGTVEIWLWKEFGRYGSYPYNVFELVTPVEELDPYYLEESTGTITLLSKLDPLYHACWHYAEVESGIEALAIAEAERDRLNEEYRKEQE